MEWDSVLEDTQLVVKGEKTLVDLSVHLARGKVTLVGCGVCYGFDP